MTFYNFMLGIIGSALFFLSTAFLGVWVSLVLVTLIIGFVIVWRMIDGDPRNDMDLITILVGIVISVGIMMMMDGGPEEAIRRFLGID
jgi:hypothetical protein